MRNGEESSAVRLLPADGSTPTSPPPVVPERPQRWFVPLLVVGGVLAAFLFATRPAGSEDVAAATTTLPPPLAAVDTEPIDLTSQAGPSNTTGEWFEATFGWDGQIHDVLRASSSFVAVGANEEGGAAWLSGTGANWREVAFLELPDTPYSSLDHAVIWRGDVVVLGSVDDGIGLWTAGTLANWAYQGQVESMGSNRITGLAAGSELLAISESDGRVEGFMSSDGIEWRPIGQLSDLDGAYIHTIAANDDWYFAAGQTDRNRPGKPIVYRSADGLRWEAVDGEAAGVLSTTDGHIASITTSPEGVFALGFSMEVQGGVVVIWKSVDGLAWERLGEHDPALRPTSTTIEVLSTRPGDYPGAQIRIDGDLHDVTTGSEIITEFGSVAISGVTDDLLRIQTSGQTYNIGIGESFVAAVPGQAVQIAVEGARIALTGFVVAGTERIPAMWTSMDGGLTWDRVTNPVGSGWLWNTLMVGSNIVGVGSNPDSGDPVVWRTSWDTETLEAPAIAQLQTYLEALNNHDAHGLVELLPRDRDGAASPHFEVPSLGDITHDWWDAETGSLDIDLVTSTADYLEATDTSIETGDCSSTVSLSTVDRVNVTCGFEVSSALLSILGYDEGSGRIQGTVSDGVLDRVAVHTAPSVPMWSTLQAGVVGSSDTDLATLVSHDEDGQPTFAPTFNGATAAVHMRLAEQYLGGLLRPGETKVVETAFGTMEWSWIDDIDLPIFSFRSATWSDIGFIATGHGRQGEYDSALSVWTSPDGFDWSQVPAPEGVESVWDLQPFLNGVVGLAWAQPDGQFIIYFDGTEWTKIAVPFADSQPEQLLFMAVGGDQILGVGGMWGEESGPIIDTAWIIGSDLIARPIELPTQDGWRDANITMSGTEDGFVVGVADFFTSAKMTIWQTTDGSAWRLITESAQIDDASYVWNLQQHRSQYFVVGEGMELNCSGTGNEGSCQMAAGLWSSPDGVTWDRVLSDNGEPVSAYQIGSGELGLVAFGQQSFETAYPRAVYLSADGTTWEQAGNLSLLHPDVDWWSVNQPAVGSDRIVVVGSSYKQDGGNDTDVPFLIVGRMIDN